MLVLRKIYAISRESRAFPLQVKREGSGLCGKAKRTARLCDPVPPARGNAGILERPSRDQGDLVLLSQRGMIRDLQEVFCKEMRPRRCADERLSPRTH